VEIYLDSLGRNGGYDLEGGNIPRYFRKKWRILLKVEIYLDILGRNGGYS